MHPTASGCCDIRRSGHPRSVASRLGLRRLRRCMPFRHCCHAREVWRDWALRLRDCSSRLRLAEAWLARQASALQRHKDRVPSSTFRSVRAFRSTLGYDLLTPSRRNSALATAIDRTDVLRASSHRSISPQFHAFGTHGQCSKSRSSPMARLNNANDQATPNERMTSRVNLASFQSQPPRSPNLFSAGVLSFSVPLIPAARPIEADDVDRWFAREARKAIGYNLPSFG